MKVWGGCSLKLAFLQGSWHGCQGYPCGSAHTCTHWTLLTHPMTWTSLNPDPIIMNIFICLNTNIWCLALMNSGFFSLDGVIRVSNNCILYPDQKSTNILGNYERVIRINWFGIVARHENCVNQMAGVHRTSSVWQTHKSLCVPDNQSGRQEGTGDLSLLLQSLLQVTD